ncbi:MAG: ImpA family metalloprotease [Thiolinea sp.]
MSGVYYDAGNGVNGFTDANGVFQYVEGEPVSFYIGGIFLGSANPVDKPLTLIDIVADKIVTPLELAGENGGLDHPEVINRVRLLLALDNDNNPENGIQITSVVIQALQHVAQPDFGAEFDPSEIIASVFQTTGRQLDFVSPAVAQSHLCDSLEYSDCGSSGTETNHPPGISGMPATSVNVGSPYTFTPTGADADDDTLTYSIANKPAWAAFDTATGTLSGTPAAADVGTTSGIVISVTDSKSAPVSLPAFALEVVQPNRAPTISGTPATSVDVGSLYTFTPTGTDADSDTLTYSITNKPSWAAFDTTSGVLSGTPAAADVGTSSGIVISVTDSKSAAVSLPAFALEVVQPNRAPTISGTPSTSVDVGSLYTFTPTGTDADDDTLTYSITNKPSWAAFDTTSGVLSGTPAASDAGTTTGIVISVTDSKSAAVSLSAFDLEVIDKLALALQTGDASLVSTEELLAAGITQAQTESEFCKAELAKIYPSGLDTTDFTARSAFMASTNPRNLPLHAAWNGGDIRVYSWVGTKADDTRYAVLGTNVFSSGSAFGSISADLKDNTLNVFRWLLKRDAGSDILSENLVILVPNSGDRDELNAWITANGLATQWTVSGDANLLSSGAFDLYLADVRRPLSEMQQAFSHHKPVIVYNHWYEPPSETLTEFGLTWRWWGGKTIGDFASVDALCNETDISNAILATLQNLQAGMPDFDYEDSDCPNNIGTVKCDLTEVTDASGNSAEQLFNAGATAIHTQLQAMDKANLDVFSLDDSYRLLKVAVLLGDKYRETISYPMDKVATDDTEFYQALFADNSVHYSRETNLLQPDMGDFTDAQTTLNTALTTTATQTYTPTEFSEWTSTGLYAPPGQVITIRRTDSSSNTVKVKFNFLRESTRLWNTDKYSRPRYMTSPEIVLEAGQNHTFSTPYGGPVYIGWSGVASGATPFTVEIQNVLENPLLEEFDEIAIQTFLNDLQQSDSDWVDIKTPYAEIHSLKSYVETSFNRQDGDESNGYTPDDVSAYINDLNNYLIAGNYQYAGFAGTSLNAEVTAFCNTQGLDSVDYDGSIRNLCADALINKKPKIQHINADINAACGAMCSGNPFDTYSPIDPLGWGENHEMGHNLQRGRLKIYDGRSSEVSNNIFPLHTQWQWAVDQGLDKHPTQNRPNNQEAFELLQSAIANGTAADANHPLWVEGGTYSKAFERLAFYIQLVYTRQSWDMYTKMYLMERIFTDALTSDTKWDAVKSLLGFADYTRTEAKDISSNDFMYIAASKIAGKNYSDYFVAWGIEVSQKARNQINALGFTQQIPAVFYYVHKELPAVMPTLADAIPLDGTSLWAKPVGGISTLTRDTNNDGEPDVTDTDDDGDNVPDNDDYRPLDATVQVVPTRTGRVNSYEQTYVNKNNLDTNYSTNSPLQVRSLSVNSASAGLLYFNIPTTLNGNQVDDITKATLTLKSVDETDPLDIYSSTDASFPTAATATWNNTNALFGDNLAAQLTLAAGSSGSAVLAHKLETGTIVFIIDETGNSKNSIVKSNTETYLDLEFIEIDPEIITVTPVSKTRATQSGGQLQYQISLTQAPADNVYVPLVLSDEATASLSASLLTFTPANYDTPQTVTVTGKNDSSGQGTKANQLLVYPLHSLDAYYNGNNPVDHGFNVYATLADAPSGQAYEATANYVGADVVYSLQNAPVGMSINEKTGVITWQPDSSQAGEYNFTIVATENGNVVNSENVNLQVTTDSDNPVNAFYVVPGGQIDNPTGSPGSIGNPFTSIETALEAAESSATHRTVYVRGGVYSDIDVTVDGINGAENDQIILTRLPGERVKLIFSGASAFSIEETSSYLVFDGFEIDGQAVNDHWDMLANHWWDPLGDRNIGGGQGFNVDGQYITIRNNYIHDAYQKGVNIYKGRYVNVHDNIVHNIGHSSLSGGHGIMRKWPRNFSVNPTDGTTNPTHGVAPGADIYKQDYDYRFDITGNMVLAVEQRIYSRVFNKGYSNLTIDEGKPILIDETDDTDPKSRISHNLVLYGGVDHIRLKQNPNMEVHNNSILADLSRTDTAPDGITDKNKLPNLQFYGNLVASKGIAIEVDDSFLDSSGDDIDPTMQKKYDNFVGGGGTVPKGPIAGITDAGGTNAGSLFADVANNNFAPVVSGNTVIPGVGSAYLTKLFTMADEYAVKVQPGGWSHDHLKNAEYIIGNVPKAVFDTSTYYIGPSTIEEGHQAIYIKFIDTDGKWLYTKLEDEGGNWNSLANPDLTDTKIFDLPNVDIQKCDSCKGAYTYQLVLPHEWFDRHGNVDNMSFFITNSDGMQSKVVYLNPDNNDEHKNILDYSAEGQVTSY